MDIFFFIANQRKLLRNELNDFILNYTGVNLLAIIALTDKIEHMCFNIGCPISVEPMLQSIATGKIKRWATGYGNNNNNERGKQLTGLHITQITKQYQNKQTGALAVESGHFRWNWTAYKLDRTDIDYIRDYFVLNVRPDFKGNRTSTIIDAKVYKESNEKTDTKFFIKVTTINENDYRFEYNTKTKKLTGNMSPISKDFKIKLINIINQSIKMNRWSIKSLSY